jgi:hypothetical protein
MTDDEILDGAGFGKGNMSYWQTVYRTNEASIHNAGRAMEFAAVPPVAIELVGVNDSRQTEDCFIRTHPPYIRPYSDPVWRGYWPPYHYSCRTYPHGIYDTAELEAYGGAQAAYYQGTYVPPRPGFGGYPLDEESWWQLTPEMLERAREYGIDGEIAGAAINLGMKNYALELVEGYETLYTSASGGYVKKAGLANPAGKEKELARLAADEGHQIFFLPESHVESVKNPDIIIDGQTGDIKHVSKPSAGAVNGAVRKAREQGASFVLMRITDSLPWETISKEVKDRMGSRIKTALVWWQGAFRQIKK